MARLPQIRGTQVGLRNLPLVDAIKADMRTGQFRFSAPEGRVGGVLDPNGIYHVEDGHHRMVAALELNCDMGDDQYVRALLSFGRWEELPAPRASRPMPGRKWWQWIRNRIGF